ncbi:MAG: hypothetical protein ACTTI3_05025 [Treponema sp.]
MENGCYECDENGNATHNKVPSKLEQAVDIASKTEKLVTKVSDTFNTATSSELVYEGLVKGVLQLRAGSMKNASGYIWLNKDECMATDFRNIVQIFDRFEDYTNQVVQNCAEFTENAQLVGTTIGAGAGAFADAFSSDRGGNMPAVYCSCSALGALLLLAVKGYQKRTAERYSDYYYIKHISDNCLDFEFRETSYEMESEIPQLDSNNLECIADDNQEDSIDELLKLQKALEDSEKK